MKIHRLPPPLYGKEILSREIPSSLEYKNPLIEEILATLAKHGYLRKEDSEEAQVRLCLDEVLVNAIRHGNKEDASKKVQVTLYGDVDRWAIDIRDEGEGFSPSDVPDVEDSANLYLEHGRGILLIREFMDEVWYYGNGNRVQLSRLKRGFWKRLQQKLKKLLQRN